MNMDISQSSRLKVDMRTHLPDSSGPGPVLLFEMYQKKKKKNLVGLIMIELIRRANDSTSTLIKFSREL